ncbi:MAG TPA: hypothetical protein VK483_10850 [Chitinophagaceae bacterium]|nr:hypothetical protein [Chitinophagaceae bacterium]
MRLLIFMSAFVLLSCGQNSSNENKEKAKNDTVKVSADTAKASVKEPVHISPGEGIVNETLKAKYGNKWHVLNDKEAKWMKDAFDYFIVPKRKEDPDYPYITKGDFNGDGRTDTAAVVTDDNKENFRIAILAGPGKIELWEEDMLINAALTTVPKGMIEGGDIDHPKKIKLKGDGINVEYFEQASFVIYWNGSSFKRIQAGD